MKYAGPTSESPLDRYIKSITRYYIGVIIAISVATFTIYGAMQYILERHSMQQDVSFLTSSQFIKFQQLANTARSLMHASSDAAIPDKVLDRIVVELNSEIAEMRSVTASLNRLNRRLDGEQMPSDFDLRLQNFLDRVTSLAQVDHESRRRRYAFWGAIDFAVASDGFMMRGFQDRIRDSFAKSENSMSMAKKVSGLLIFSPLLVLFGAGVFVVLPLLRKLSAEYEKNKLAQREFAEGARQDALTHLPNRMHFNQVMAQLVMAQTARDGAPQRQPFALVLIDLDHFKSINDRFGHPAGDSLLCAASERIAAVLDERAMAARLGGDEFAILLPEVSNADDVKSVATRLCEILAQPFTIDNHTFRISGSIGAAIFPEHGETSDALIRCADLALYAAKMERNNGLIFNKQMMESRIEESKLRTALFQAVQNNELVVYYQPKIDLHGSQPVAFEALLRWRHPQLGILAPGKFLHLYNTAASIIAMTECVVNQVADDIRRWRDRSLRHGSVAINMPEVLLISDVGYAMLEQAVVRQQLEWSDFSIEITEDVFVSKHREQITATVEKLRARGVAVALDDFGTGFASLANLRDFPVDDIKIDRSFVFEIGIDAKSEKIIQAVIELAKSLGSRSVAEGVETQAQLHFLRGAGCDVGQGYLFARPEPFENVVCTLTMASPPYLPKPFRSVAPCPLETPQPLEKNETSEILSNEKSH